jgi:hypothetical protein
VFRGKVDRDVERLLEIRPAVIAAVQRRYRSLFSADVVRLDDDVWLDRSCGATPKARLRRLTARAASLVRRRRSIAGAALTDRKSWCPRFESGSRHTKKPWKLVTVQVVAGRVRGRLVAGSQGVWLASRASASRVSRPCLRVVLM